jgi:hypothetical protein
MTMAIIARLSRQFYDKFGDAIVNELVEWLNQVDVALRDEMHRINDAAYLRFEARFEQRLSELKADLLKWMFVFWATNMLAILGLMLK